MKKILIFSLAYVPHVGGAELALKELTDRLEDFEFHVLTLRFREVDPPEERVGNVVVHRIGPPAGGWSSYLQKMLFIPRAVYAARALHAEHRFALWWAMMTYMVLPVAILRLGGLRVPYVLTLQDGDPFTHVFRRLRILPLVPLLHYGFRHATAVSVLSRYLAGWARRMGARREPHIIPNGVEVAHFAGAQPREVGKKDGEFWLITTSRLVHKNGLDDVIRALVLLPTSVHLLILGSGPLEKKLKALATSFGLNERTHFVGHVPYAELPGYLHACDAFVRPSRTEGFGSSFIEAMAAGLPIIATQEGGIADFLFDARRNPNTKATGFAVDPNSAEQIADVVKELMTDPQKVQSTRQNAFTMVRERYEWSTVAKQMRELFATIPL